ILWDLLKNSYRDGGPSAWASGQVPSHRSNNAFIAKRYANVIAAFANDFKQGPPVTIIEVGAGAGRLAYYITKHLVGLLADRGASSDPPFRFIVTDVAPSNVEAWERCGAFGEY